MLYHTSISNKNEQEDKLEKKNHNIMFRIKRNDELLEKLQSFKNDGNLEEFLNKYLEFKYDENLLVEKINNFREELEKLGLKVPPKLIIHK